MLNITSSLASIGQILRTSNSKPTATPSTTPAPSNNLASTASISDQGQAMLAQSRMSTSKAPSRSRPAWKKKPEYSLQFPNGWRT